MPVAKTGALSRRERDELKAFGAERGLRVYDDIKRLERDFPEALAAEITRAKAVGLQAWTEALAASDYSRFRDALARHVELRHAYIG